MKMNVNIVCDTNRFKYLGYSYTFYILRNASSENMKNRITCRWMKWRETSGVLCDKKMTIRLKDRYYKAIASEPSNVV